MAFVILSGALANLACDDLLVIAST